MHAITASTEQWLDSAPDGVVIVDDTGLIQLVNTTAEGFFGYTSNELVGQPIEMLIPERLRPQHRGHRATFPRSFVTRGMGTTLDLVARRKDGSELPVDVSLSPFETSQGKFVSAAIRDITHLREVESKLESFGVAASLAAVIESSQDAIVGKTLGGVITSWNAGAEQIYGYSAEEIIGHSISELIPGDRIGELEYIIQRVSQGESVRHFETQRVTKDGRILDMSVAITPIRDSRGAVTGAAAVARDMTDIVQAGHNQSSLEAQLHRAQRLESLGQLAGGVAHDFNNLLAGIMNYSGLISAGVQHEIDRRGLANDDEAMVMILDDASQITKVARRAADLTRQLLIFSRREVLRPQVLDLNSVIEDMEGLLRATIGQNVDRLETSLAQDLPLITIDRGQIEQVLMNLAINARDAMPGGGELRIATATIELDADEARHRKLEHGTYVRLTVSDTGSGMSPDVVARAFEPFFTTKPTGEGTGLGLATVFGIVTQVLGEVEVSSTPGLGTTVRIHIPAAIDSTLEPPPVTEPAPRSAKNETVLLVEDENAVREPARRMLAKLGYTVLEACSADEAMVIVRGHANTIDLLLTDVVMPGRSGKELSLDVLALRPATKVLFMSGYSESVIVHNGILDEGVDLLEKPFSADDLARGVRKILHRGS